MKFVFLTLVISTLAVSTSAFAFAPKLGNPYLQTKPLFMSDDQPSDSSTEFTVDVESEPFEPTESEEMVTTILDDLPLSFEDVSPETRAKINEEVLKLETLNPTENATSSPLLNGVWLFRYSGGYSTEWALPSPTRQLALFLYSGGYSPGLFGITLAKQLPSTLVDVGDLTISISRDQPRIEASVGVKFLNGTEREIKLNANMDVKSNVRFVETYDKFANFLGREVEIPEKLQYSRDLYIVYLDEDLLVVRDSTGVPEILVRK